MMFSRQIVAVVAAGLLAAHAVVGCCAHHAHAESPATWGATDGCGGCQCQHYDGHHAAGSNEPAHEEPCGEHCSAGSCAFVAGSKVVLPELSQPAGMAVAGELARPTFLAPTCFERPFERPLLPPLRSHLMKCVLLV